MDDINQNYEAVQSNIADAISAARRNLASVGLTAVSKRQPEGRVDALLGLGHRCFGENRVQEAMERWSDRRAQYNDLELRLIGALQSNKARDAVALFDVIETLDRPKLVTALAAEQGKQKKELSYFIQVNTGDEQQKSGVSPENLEALYQQAVNECGLNVVGLMCIPPIDEPVGLHFGLLKTFADHIGLSQLSMGMSGDYERAIAFGATQIRVGSALFGARA
jgi:pyridoxal phosphate enzyme (YggS family)